MAPHKPILAITTDLALLSHEDLSTLKANGLGWVRPHVRPWVKTLRNPGLGTIVEITTEDLARCVPIDSDAAQRLFCQIAVR